MKASPYIAQLPARVAGIPCQVGVTAWEPYDPGRTSGPPEFCYPPEGGEGEWELLDQRGRPAAWLARKLTTADEQRIESAIFNHFERGTD